MIAILAALETELSPLRESVKGASDLELPECRVTKGLLSELPVLLVRTGMGRTRAESAIRVVLERYDVKQVVSMGFAGGLRRELRVGDVVACDRLLCSAPAQTGNPWPVLECADVPIADSTRCTCVTSDELQVDPMEKQALASAFNACIVDMESYWIARTASVHNVPIHVVRVLSDRLGDRMLPFDEIMTNGGRLRTWATVRHFVCHPLDLRILGRLAASAPASSRRLSRAVSLLIRAIGTKGSG